MNDHIAIFTLPTKGHIYPVLGICHELVTRGYRVTFATTANGGHLVGQGGIEPVIFNLGNPASAWGFPRWPSKDPRWWKLIAKSFLNLTRHAALAVGQLETFYRDNPPVAVIYDDCSYAGRVISNYTNSLAIQFYTNFAKDEFFTWEDGIGRDPPPMIEFSESLDSFFFAHGIGGINHLWHKADLNISPMPRALQYEENRFDSQRFSFVGPCLRPYTNSWKRRGKGRQSILISDQAELADSEYFNCFISALAGSGYNVILSVGERVPLDRLLSLPENFEINQYVSHLDILQHVDLWISAGGAASALESLYFGVPMLSLPRWPPQEVVAARIDDLGLGINCPRHLMTAEKIRSNVSRVLGDGEIARKVLCMQDTVRNSGGAVVAVDRIEAALQKRT